MIIHSKDDPLASYEAAGRAAARIQGATRVGLRSGGHLALGQTEIVHGAVAPFLQDTG